MSRIWACCCRPGLPWQRCRRRSPTRSGGCAGCSCGRGSACRPRRGRLQVVNEMAPAGRHAELISTYLLACYAGVSLPVIGIGLLSQWVGPLIADVVFAAVIAIMAILALLVGARYTPPQT